MMQKIIMIIYTSCFFFTSRFTACVAGSFAREHVCKKAVEQQREWEKGNSLLNRIHTQQQNPLLCRLLDAQQLSYLIKLLNVFFEPFFSLHCILHSFVTRVLLNLSTNLSPLCLAVKLLFSQQCSKIIFNLHHFKKPRKLRINSRDVHDCHILTAYKQIINYCMEICCMPYIIIATKFYHQKIYDLSQLVRWNNAFCK